MLDFDTAQAQIAARGQAPTATLSAPLDALAGRVLAQDMIATLDLPPADNSAMDGYALRLADYAPGRSLPIQQRCYAGETPEALRPGQAIRLFTGSLLPAGADTVVMQEDCHEADEAVQILQPPQRGLHIRRRGEDMARNTIVLPRGTLLGPAHIAILAAQGLDHAAVYPRLRLGLLTTGDELIAPGEPLPPAAIYNSNGPMLTALCQQMNTEVCHVLHVPDQPAQTEAALRTLLADCDLVLSIGGASVGEKDLIKPAIEALGGALDLWRVSMKPGKPVALADIGGRPIVCLPGNPVSAFVVFTLLVTPLIRALQGRIDIFPPVQRGTLRSEKPWGGGTRDDFLRVQVAYGDALPALTPHVQQSSGAMSSLAWAHGLARVPSGEPVSDGTPLDWYALADWLR
ncbi:molybdopterin molybdotransferase MoeA [Alcaligenaceae bacterium CGII-47]|nr:molybdopterin molybdotransferase MoeA [Alcaligenaceae bacterium CGII-47]